MFFKQKTAYEMRISDWSSDVCSSDLVELEDLPLGQVECFPADGEPDVFVSDHRQVHAMRMRERKIKVLVRSDCAAGAQAHQRSEERRVGTEWGSTCRSRWSPEH